MEYNAIIVIAAVLLFVVAGLIWLFGCHGLDKIKHPEEWKTAGSSGERIVYNTLITKFKIPEQQILRNVYIPTKTGKTSEIDFLAKDKIEAPIIPLVTTISRAPTKKPNKSTLKILSPPSLG